MGNIIKKIWGIRHRLISNEQTEVDLLTLDKGTGCSIHNHENKINRFVLLSGVVSIKSDLGTHFLKINEPFDIEPPTYHQFVVHEKSVMIEIAFVNNGTIDPDDIYRVKQGGKFIDGKFYTLDELKINEWKDYG